MRLANWKRRSTLLWVLLALFLAATPALAQQDLDAKTIFLGATGATRHITTGTTDPSGGANGDFYLKSDGTLYTKKGGAWVAVSTSTGTVTSAGLSVPTGFSVTGSPVTTSGTLALGFATGYSLPSDTTQSGWSAKMPGSYPGSGLVTSTGSAWGTSITDNSSNWNSAYTWTNTNGTNVTNHLASTSNPHSVTASQVSLGNVTNESKATMFSSPAFTGTVTMPTGLGGLLFATAGVVSTKAIGSDVQAQLSGTGFVKASGTTISYDNSTYLTSVPAHALLSATHSDTQTGITVLRGGLMVVNSTPQWSQLVLGNTGNFLRSNGTDIVWSAVSYSDVGAEASGAVATHAALTTGVHGVGANTILHSGNIGSSVQAYNSNLTAINQALTTTSSPSFTTVTAALSGNASTASALASTPSGCSAGQYAKGIAANGNLSCESVTSGKASSVCYLCSTGDEVSVFTVSGGNLITIGAAYGDPSTTINTAIYGTLKIGGGTAISSSTNLASLAGLSYASASFVKMTAAGTFTLDAATYSVSSHTHSGTYEPVITAGTTGQYWRGDKSWQTLDKSAVGLGSVENTALSTWAGTSNIVTVGALNAGSITSGFGSIDVGADAISGGAITAGGNLSVADGYSLYYAGAANTNQYLLHRAGNSDVLFSIDSGDFYLGDIANSTHNWYLGNTNLFQISTTGLTSNISAGTAYLGSLNLKYSATSGSMWTYSAAAAVTYIDNYYEATSNGAAYGDIVFRTKVAGGSTLTNALVIGGYAQSLAWGGGSAISSSSNVQQFTTSGLTIASGVVTGGSWNAGSVTSSGNIGGVTGSFSNLVTLSSIDGRTSLGLTRNSTTANAVVKFATGVIDGAGDRWIMGLRNTSDDLFRFYGYAFGGDVFTLNNSTGAATFAAGASALKFSTSSGTTQTASASTTGINIGFDANTERGWIQATRNSAAETRTLQLNPLGNRVYVRTAADLHSDEDFQVNGLSYFSQAMYVAAGVSATTLGIASNQFNVIASGNGVDVYSKAGNTGQIALYGGAGYSGGGAVTVYGESHATSPNVISFHNSGYTERMRVAAGGNVLIGTTTDAGYKLDVNGTLHAGELLVSNLVARNTISTIGGRVVTAPTTLLVADLSAGGTTIHVKHAGVLANGDRIYMEKAGQVEWIAVASAASGSEPDVSYTITRGLDSGGTGHAWASGDAVMDSGTTGGGYIDQYSQTALYGSSTVGPTMLGMVRTGTTYSDLAARWLVGRMDGWYGKTATSCIGSVPCFGLGAGNPSGNYLIASQDGISLNNGTLSITTAGVSIATTTSAGDYSRGYAFDATHKAMLWSTKDSSGSGTREVGLTASDDSYTTNRVKLYTYNGTGSHGARLTVQDDNSSANSGIDLTVDTAGTPITFSFRNSGATFPVGLSSTTATFSSTLDAQGGVKFSGVQRFDWSATSDRSDVTVAATTYLVLITATHASGNYVRGFTGGAQGRTLALCNRGAQKVYLSNQYAGVGNDWVLTQGAYDPFEVNANSCATFVWDSAVVSGGAWMQVK